MVLLVWRPPQLHVGLDRSRGRTGARPGSALPAHYPWGFDTIGHLGLVYLATAIFVAGALLALKSLAEARR